MTSSVSSSIFYMCTFSIAPRARPLCSICAVDGRSGGGRVYAHFACIADGVGRCLGERLCEKGDKGNKANDLLVIDGLTGASMGWATTLSGVLVWIIF